MTEEEKKSAELDAEKMVKCFEEIHEMLKDENPWASEEEMIAELANDRRRAMGLPLKDYSKENTENEKQKYKKQSA